MQQIVIASNNAGKIKEFSQMLAPFSLEVRSAANFNIASVAETGQTFIENALLKARSVSEQTHLPCIADDSGLVVNSLKGAPGLHSARYAGDNATDADNIAKLLAELKSIAPPHPACFHCSLVFLRHAEDPNPIIAQGNWQGEIVSEARGENGFGYDPVFFLPQLQKTSAQLNADEKNKISHRGKALNILLTLMEDLNLGNLTSF